MAGVDVQHTKRPAPDSDSADSPEQTPKRNKNSEFNPTAIKKMGYTFEIPAVIAKARSKIDRPFDMGMALGTMFYYILPLLSTHLENAVEFQNKPPAALSWATGFVEAIDQYVAHLRLTDGCSEKFPNDQAVNRQSRRPRRKYMERYTHIVGTAYKEYVREQLCDVFQAWDKEHTQLFNKGVDKALSGIQWAVYPDENVVLQAGNNDWAIWLRGQCEELGMVEARAGRRVFEDM